MNILLSILPLVVAVSLPFVAQAGRIGEMLTQHPERLAVLLDGNDYSKQLQFIKDAYAEHQSDPDETIAEYACMMAISKVPRDHQIALGLDFTLNQTDMDMRFLGAHAVYITLAEGTPLDEATRTRLLNRLKQDLGSLTTPNHKAYEIARYEVDALMLLGADEGLDSFLTDTKSVRNYSVVDEWETDSQPEHFNQLATQYTEKANRPDNSNPDPYKTRAAIYQLAKSRRLKNVKIEPLHPLVNLDSLLGH